MILKVQNNEDIKRFCGDTLRMQSHGCKDKEKGSPILWLRHSIVMACTHKGPPCMSIMMKRMALQGNELAYVHMTIWI